MGLSDDEIQRRKDKAASYRLMLESWAWKDFESFLENMRTTTVNDFINFEENRAVEFRMGQYKGTLDCLGKIKREIESTVNP